MAHIHSMDLIKLNFSVTLLKNRKFPFLTIQSISRINNSTILYIYLLIQKRSYVMFQSAWSIQFKLIEIIHLTSKWNAIYAPGCHSFNIQISKQLQFMIPIRELSSMKSEHIRTAIHGWFGFS